MLKQFTLAAAIWLVSMAQPVAAQQAQASDGVTIAAVGDIVAATAPSLADERFAPVARLLSGADAVFGNFESSALDPIATAATPSAEPSGGWLLTPPSVLPGLRGAGFNLLSRANNHATDFGVDGMLETDRLLTQQGFVIAGTGGSLAHARAPRFLDTPRARIALVAATTTFTPSSRAGPAYGVLAPRPGASTIRLTRLINVDQQTFEAIGRMKERQPSGADLTPSRLGLGTSQTQDIDLLGARFRLSTEPGYSYALYPRDLAEVSAAIGEARKRSDIVIFSLHAHEPGNWSETPADVLQQIARAAIDAGADAVVGHGPHQLRGIEVYKGRPILYSLGNFFYQTKSFGEDTWAPMEVSGYDPMLMTPEQARLLGAERWYEGIVVHLNFDRDKKIRELRFHPVDLGQDLSGRDKGSPGPASAAMAERILTRLDRLSARYGTRLEINRGVAVLQIGQ